MSPGLEPLPHPGSKRTLLLRLSTGTQMECSEHPLLYHLDTGEMEELPVGVDSAVLEQSDSATWSDNFQLALITGRVSEEFPNGREWLYDRETGTLTDVKDLGSVGADVAAFADDETHYLLVYQF